MQALESASPKSCRFLISRCNVSCFAVFPQKLLLEQVRKLKSKSKKENPAVMPTAHLSDGQGQQAKKIINYVIVTPHDDHSGKVYSTKESWEFLYTKMKDAEIQNPEVECNLLVTEFDNPIDLLHRLENWSQRFGRFQGGIENGHGNSQGIDLKILNNGQSIFSRTDIQRLLARKTSSYSFVRRLMACFEPNPQFVLDSCLTAKGKQSLAKIISEVGAEVFASQTIVRSLFPNFNAFGNLKLNPDLGGDVKFKNGRRAKYTAPLDEQYANIPEDVLIRFKKIWQRRK